MRRQPSGAARLAGFLLLLCAGLALGRAAPAASARDLGPLGPFYRATQLQGHLIGTGLIETPTYLTASDIDVNIAKGPGRDARSQVPRSSESTAFSAATVTIGCRNSMKGTIASADGRSITQFGGATAPGSSARN